MITHIMIDIDFKSPVRIGSYIVHFFLLLYEK